MNRKMLLIAFIVAAAGTYLYVQHHKRPRGKYSQTPGFIGAGDAAPLSQTPGFVSI